MSLKKKQVKKEVKKKDKSCECAVIAIVLAIVVAAGVGLYYFLQPSRPEIGACYKHVDKIGFAVVKDIDSLDYVSYNYYFPYQDEDSKGNRERTLEGFNERYVEKIDYSSCFLADDLIIQTESKKYFKDLLLKKVEKK